MEIYIYGSRFLVGKTPGAGCMAIIVAVFLCISLQGTYCIDIVIYTVHMDCHFRSNFRIASDKHFNEHAAIRLRVLQFV